MSIGDTRTVSPSVAAAAMLSMNSKNCVARTIEYGIDDAGDQLLLRDLGPQVAAVGQPVGADDGHRDVMSDPGGRLGGEQVAGRRREELEDRAASSNDGEFDTSTTTDAPSRASARPSPVMVLTPVFGAAASASWPCSRSSSTSFDPDASGAADDHDLHGVTPS